MHLAQVVILGQALQPEAWGNGTAGNGTGMGNCDMGSLPSRERTRMGAKGRALKGMISGQPKFGYSIGEDGKPVVNPNEAAIVQRVFAEYIDGRGASEIVDRLNNDGLFTRRGGRWRATDLARVTGETTYKGEGYFGKQRAYTRDGGERDVRHRNNMPKEDWIPIPYPPLVDAEIWERAQEIRKRNYRMPGPRDSRLKYPLRGLVWCGTCGGRFVGNGRHSNVKRERRKDGSLYEKRIYSPRRRYLCLRSMKKQEDCPRKSITALQLEEPVWQKISELLSSPNAIEELIETRREEIESGGVMKTLDRARGELAGLEQERGRRLAQNAKGYISEAELDLALRGISERLEHSRDDVRRLERETVEIAGNIHALDDFIAMADRIRDRLATMDDTGKTEVFELLIEKVVIDSDGIQIVLGLGGATNDGTPKRRAELTVPLGLREATSQAGRPEATIRSGRPAHTRNSKLYATREI